MEIELRYSIPVPEGSQPGEPEFVRYRGDLDEIVTYKVGSNSPSAADIEKLDDGSIAVYLECHDPCTLVLSPEVLAAIEALRVQTSSKFGGAPEANPFD
jgi:hypothetical protein